MKFKKLLTEAESIQICLSYNSTDDNVPKNQYKLPFFFLVREMKNALKNAKTPAECETIVNTYTKVREEFKYIKDITYNNNTYMFFKSKGYQLWICTKYKTDDFLETIKNDYPVGTILVSHYGYDMTIYDFYKITGYDKQSVILSHLETVDLGNRQDYHKVIPGSKVLDTKKYRIIVSGTKAYINVDYSKIYFDKLYVYDNNKTYNANYMD